MLLCLIKNHCSLTMLLILLPFHLNQLVGSWLLQRLPNVVLLVPLSLAALYLLSFLFSLLMAIVKKLIRLIDLTTPIE